ncbi:MAG: heavy metal translocating P-type ATPase [Actinomycetaceae bacterium]|nr:heavy metal translocating P-type ATPase [Actinomycetaceae bacterium]MDU0969863.1 heavy metal translocating P-type ATPase [Actinomycetaceae bacterium]
MTRVKKFIRRYPELALTLIVGIVSIILAACHFTYLQWFVSGFAILIAARLFWDMIRDILAGSWGIDLLAITAIISTVAVGEYWAALVVCLMLSGGESLEEYAASRARSQLTGLLEGAPTHALRVTDAGPVEVAIDDVKVGDRLLVRPGQTVPVDGTLLSDHATTEESSLTGEPLPVEHAKGDLIPSGGVNGADAIEIEARAVAADSQYQQIIALVKQAQDSQAPVVRMADRVAIPFTLLSFAIAGIAWWASGDPVRLAEVLVVATPCPLLLAAPVAFLAGVNRAAKEGIIVKDSGALERLAKARTVAMDKTGTLTFGHPRMVDVVTDGTHDADRLLAAAASVEAQSSHALAAAVVEAAHDRNLPTGQVADMTEVTGKGARGTVDGHVITVGSGSWIGAPDSAPQIHAGQILIHVGVDGEWAGAFVMEDEIRPDAADTVRAMQTMGVADVMMITGDGQETAREVARTVGIEDVRFSLLPAEKVQAITHATRPVVAIGDGVNDAPVLATADVGIAMGARGSSAASESADVVVMLDDIHLAARAIAIGKRTTHVAMQSIGIGVALSIVLMLIGTTGIMPAIVGAIAQEVVDLSCIIWALLAARPARREVMFDASARSR